MRILAFVDSHGNPMAMRELEKKSKKADILLCAGDLTVFEQDMEKVLKRFDSWGKPMLIIPGNHEGESSLQKACKQFPNLEFFHKKAKIINNILFIGFGGGGFEKTTPELADFFRKNKEFLELTETKVFMFHAPPYNTKVDLIGRSHNGSQTEKELIMRYKPDLTVCGHFHENFGKSEKVGKGIVINPGPYGWLIEL
jgi:uncharacterized protein